MNKVKQLMYKLLLYNSLNEFEADLTRYTPEEMLIFFFKKCNDLFYSWIPQDVETVLEVLAISLLIEKGMNMDFKETVLNNCDIVDYYEENSEEIISKLTQTEKELVVNYDLSWIKHYSKDELTTYDYLKTLISFINYCKK